MKDNSPQECDDEIEIDELPVDQGDHKPDAKNAQLSPKECLQIPEDNFRWHCITS